MAPVSARWLRDAALRTALACALCPACDANPGTPQPGGGAPSQASGRSAGTSTTTPARLTIDGTRLLRGVAPFEWRGITAFRLVQQVASGREADAIAYLDWARAQKLTVVRVLTMAKHLFVLNPADGLTALPRVLSLAAERGLIVEVVALADTSEVPVDPLQHVKAIGDIVAAHPNAIVEIANEPWHPTQDPRLHDPVFVRSLANAVPAGVPVALGSLEGADGYAAGGGYATWHSPRSNGQDGWGHVLALAEGAALVARWQKPVVSDEPIGAAEAVVPGRRDNDPRRFAAAAALTRLAGLGATFHHEGGLQARIPAGRELECFRAWSGGLDAMAAMPSGGRFLNGADLAPIAAVSGARGAFGRQYEAEVWVVLVDPAQPGIAWKEPWRETSRVAVGGVLIIRASARV